jgi:hypothetical protein
MPGAGLRADDIEAALSEAAGEKGDIHDK